MKIRDRIRVKFNGKNYELVAASNGSMETLKSGKGYSSFFDKPAEEHVIPENYKPLHGQNLYVACDLFMTAKWPGNEPLTKSVAKILAKTLNQNR